MEPQNVLSAAIVSTTTPDTNVTNGSLWYNPTTRDINVFVNNTWYPLFSSLINPVLSSIDQVSSSFNNQVTSSLYSLQQFENDAQTYIQQFKDEYNNLLNQYNNQNSLGQNYLSQYNNCSITYNHINNSLTNLVNQYNLFTNGLQNNLLFYTSVSFQVLTGYYIYTFNFENLYNSFKSVFGNNNFQVIGIITMPFQYYPLGSSNVSESGYYFYYPLLYHVESDLIYSSSNQTGTFTVAIGPQGPGVSNLSNGLYLHDYAQDSSAEMYEIKFFAGPFNTSQQVTSSLTSSWYFNQYYGTSTYSGSNVSTTTLNIFGYSIGIYL